MEVIWSDISGFEPSHQHTYKGSEIRKAVGGEGGGFGKHGYCDEHHPSRCDSYGLFTVPAYWGGLDDPDTGTPTPLTLAESELEDANTNATSGAQESLFDHLRKHLVYLPSGRLPVAAS